MLGDRTHRTIEDIDETVLNAAQMKAIALGDPLIMERATLETKLQGLGMQLQAYSVSLNSLIDLPLFYEMDISAPIPH